MGRREEGRRGREIRRRVGEKGEGAKEGGGG